VEHDVTKAVVAEYLAPFREDRPDALVLGCTHYPVLKGPIREYLGEGTRLIDSGEEAARWVDVLLSEMGEKARGGAGGASFLVTDDPERFARVGERILGRPLEGVAKVSL
jgi:glutamate racemase